MADFKQRWHQLEQKAKDIGYRTTDRHLRLAVTGLSGAGKTAFITSLVEKLLTAATQPPYGGLPLFSVCMEQRFYGAQRARQPDLNIASFGYDAAMQALRAELPTWPKSTTNISELRLAIEYQPKAGLLATLTDKATLHLDIVDYPGEWLLDLPMLRQSFYEWSEQLLAPDSPLSHTSAYASFIANLKTLDAKVEPADETLAAVADSYRLVLEELVHQQGFYLAQPGRMLLPGDLQGTPLLAFFPLPRGFWLDHQGQTVASPLVSSLEKRYRAYVKQVVKPFYQRYFEDFDRQLVLVDVLGALNRGRAQFEDMANALNALNQSFRFGKGGFWQRLFSPKIDRLVFAVSKVDQITREQQGNALSLLKHLLQPGWQHADESGCQVEAMAVSAIKTTRYGVVKDRVLGEVSVVSGTELSDDRPTLTLFPGEVPTQLPDDQFWQQQGFQFVNFAPPLMPVDQPFDHIRLDHLLEFLLGDKLS
ncbi:YcjX family protein [Shewanella avicenniae]|uniref:YcjX family protein n=1 Tax=Shewanella avicenniae TaxID=2814294 RepID=A0ABX7QWA5_9GAMM|nr:YcjX family protein [Shewanella avicenniae]QSX34913.1 YcjX family protein [Shewanella avicenniae]